jgi:hypothetical protein
MRICQGRKGIFFIDNDNFSDCNMFAHLALQFCTVLAMCLFVAAKADCSDTLWVCRDAYPRVFFFRQSEGMAANQRLTYEQWEKTFERLMGIEGKVLEEEVPGRSVRNIEFFTRFKKRHPDQLVLLHFNGNARDPRFESEKFFAGHWIYYRGTRILSDVPAEESQTEIRVGDPSLFRVNMGRYRNANEDIGLCMLAENGQPDWHKSEQVQLISINNKSKTIRVRRGCYGTTPRTFSANKAYAAAHVTEGPWGRNSHLLWFYNYSTRCPQDTNGRTCADILVEDLAELFGAGGQLEDFDGLEFDVLHNRCSGDKRGPDCDADGHADRGVFDGTNTYGAGVVEFCRKLRQALGEDLIILADGHSANNQRAFGILNGIESEGWPSLRDHEVQDWSGGLNRHLFWKQNGRPPAFNYINHKFIMPTGEPGRVKRPDVPFNIHRLVFAAGVFTDSAICYSFRPANDPDGLLGIWDEFRQGRADKIGWLGEPLGPAVRIAKGKPDMLAGAGKERIRGLLRRLSGPGLEFASQSGLLKIVAKDPEADAMKFRLRNVPCNGPDLFISMRTRAAPRRNYPKEMARLMWVGIAPAGGVLTKPVRFMTWCNQEDFSSGFYFSQVESRKVDLEFIIESGEALWISELSAHAHADVIYREFENGLVLANPSPRPYTFDLDKLAPGTRFRRIRGTRGQDTATNNGDVVTATVVVGPKDALFLVKEN